MRELSHLPSVPSPSTLPPQSFIKKGKVSFRCCLGIKLRKTAKKETAYLHMGQYTLSWDKEVWANTKMMVTVLSDKNIFKIFLKVAPIHDATVKMIVVSAECNFSEFETICKIKVSTIYGWKYEVFKLRKMMTVMTNILEISRLTPQWVQAKSI